MSNRDTSGTGPWVSGVPDRSPVGSRHVHLSGRHGDGPWVVLWSAGRVLCAWPHGWPRALVWCKLPAISGEGKSRWERPQDRMHRVGVGFLRSCCELLVR